MEYDIPDYFDSSGIQSCQVFIQSSHCPSSIDNIFYNQKVLQYLNI